MIVRPTTPTAKLGRKNIKAATEAEAIASYRKRFGALADGVELTVEKSHSDERIRSSPDSMVGTDTGTEGTGAGGEGGGGGTSDE